MLSYTLIWLHMNTYKNAQTFTHRKTAAKRIYSLQQEVALRNKYLHRNNVPVVFLFEKMGVDLLGTLSLPKASV